jgi:hypothetical protein
MLTNFLQIVQDTSVDLKIFLNEIFPDFLPSALLIVNGGSGLEFCTVQISLFSTFRKACFLYLQHLSQLRQ